MQIKLLCIGKIKERWLQQGIEEFQKRLSRYCTIEIVEKSDSSDSLPLEKALEDEAQQIHSVLAEKDFVILLDLQGKMLDSIAFAQKLPQYFERGGAQLTFVIGGSRGLASSLRARAQLQLCLSPMTFTHQMTRLLLLEQLYRAFKIQRNEPYHK